MFSTRSRKPPRSAEGRGPWRACEFLEDGPCVSAQRQQRARTTLSSRWDACQLWTFHLSALSLVHVPRSRHTKGRI